jgi:hypothetical protein
MKYRLDQSPSLLRETGKPRKCRCGKSLGVQAYKVGERFYCSEHCMKVERAKWARVNPIEEVK